MDKWMKYTITMSIFLIMVQFQLFGQLTKIMGVVKDEQTEEPMPFVNIFFKGTSIGTISDFNGEFSIETRSPGDSLFASFVGYHSQAFPISPGRFQTINFNLSMSSISLSEVVIVAGENPADIIMRKVIFNKENNTKKGFDFYEYEVYNKIQFDANNLNEKFTKRKVLQPFKVIFDHIDTSTVNGKAFLPVFITESLSKVYYRHQPRAKREYIKAQRASGFENESLANFMGDIYQNVDIYENYISLFEKNFVSPISNSAFISYKFYLVDSSYVENKWCYQIMFKPKRKQELTFTGNIWINDTSFAIKKVDMKIAEDANINFINDVSVRQEYGFIDNKTWMVTKDNLIVDFNALENSKTTIGFYARRSTSYSNFVFDQPKLKEIYSIPTTIKFEENSINLSEEYWNKARPDTLTIKERGIYQMVDSIKNVSLFKTYLDVVYTITNGYYINGNVEIGPYYRMLSFNQIEGTRIRLGGRTSNKFSTKTMLSAHIAYGFKDQKFKYGLGIMQMLAKNPRRSLGVDFKYDIEQLGQSDNAYSTDNLFTSFLTRNPSNKLSTIRQYKTWYEHEWFSGFTNTLTFTQREIFPVATQAFKVMENDVLQEVPSIRTSEIKVDIRFAYNERFLMGEFERISLGTTYPIFEFTYAYGIPDLINSDYSYHRVSAGIRQWFNIGTLGWSKYIIEAGRIWGELPYPLLKMHEGNETFMFDENSYNLMNYYEFISDQYLSLYYTHHFDGLFFNKIPLFRKLKWREVAFVKGAIGTLSSQNKVYSEFPSITYTLENPYWEAGIGVENIFKFLRVDAVWRLSHLDHYNVSPFGLFFSFQFVF